MYDGGNIFEGEKCATHLNRKGAVGFPKGTGVIQPIATNDSTNGFIHTLARRVTLVPLGKPDRSQSALRISDYNVFNCK